MMFLPEQTVASLKEVLKRFTGFDKQIQVLESVSGGSINRCFQIGYGTDRYFLKLNSTSKFPTMFDAEAKGLKRITDTNTIKVPEVISFGIAANEQFLLLEWVEKGINNTASQQLLGRNLAHLHKTTNEDLGIDHDNYMGSLTQSNRARASRTEFFIHERLIPQVELGKQSGLLNKGSLDQFESLYKKLADLYPAEEPSLVHGDLWSGNYMINHLREPVLFDPAIAYSNREVDIAMTTLFGGFQRPFYDAYNEAFPLQKGWETRLGLWNLYPLLIHVNLFGISYVSQVREILNRFA